MTQRYRVGQILYVVLNKQSRVIPCQVCEEHEKKTLQGQTTSYKVTFGKEDPQLVDLESIDGEIFVSADEMRKTLTGRASKTISKLCENAVSKAKEWYQSSAVATPVQEAPKQELEDFELGFETTQTVPLDEVVVLPDGRKAKANFKMPKDLSRPTK